MTAVTGAIKRAKLQSNRHHQQTNNQLFRPYRPDVIPVTQPRESTEGKSITFHRLVHPKLVWGSYNLAFEGSQLPWGRLPDQ